MDATSISIGLAFAAGLISFLSPCVLPIVPGYLGYLSGVSVGGEGVGRSSPSRGRAVLHAALFVLGFSLVFVALGASATALGSTLRGLLPVLQRVGGVMVALFGLYLLGLLRLGFLMRERRFELASRPAGKVGSVLTGVAFGAGWTPCIGPVLASVLLYAGMEETMARGMLLLTAYALGLGLPFLVAAAALDRFLSGARLLRRWGMPLQRGTGGVLLVLGILLATGRFAQLTAGLARYTPFIDVGL
ncbi:cytochrome c biogenesis protein CcdA [soil metagenome]